MLNNAFRLYSLFGGVEVLRAVLKRQSWLEALSCLVHTR